MFAKKHTQHLATTPDKKYRFSIVEAFPGYFFVHIQTPNFTVALPKSYPTLQKAEEASQVCLKAFRDCDLSTEAKAQALFN